MKPYTRSIALAPSNRCSKISSSEFDPNTTSGKEDELSSVFEFQSVLRIRPLSRNEQQDKNEHIILWMKKNDKEMKTVQLCKYETIGKYEYNKPRKKAIMKRKPIKYIFDSILEPEATQLEVYKRLNILNIIKKVIHPIQNYQNIYTKSDEIKKYRYHQHDHVLIALGTFHSGKSFTLFGKYQISQPDKKIGRNISNKTQGKNTNLYNISNQNEEGVLPRIIDDLFSTFDKNDQLQGGIHNFSICVRLCMILVFDDNFYDILSYYDKNNSVNTIPSSSPQRKRKYLTRNTRSKKVGTPSEVVHEVEPLSNVFKLVSSFENQEFPPNFFPESSLTKESQSFSNSILQINQDPLSQKFHLHPVIITSHNAKHLRDILLTQVQNYHNKYSSRGHMLIRLQPVLRCVPNNIDNKVQSTNFVVAEGGTITVIAMEGLERMKKRCTSGTSLRKTVGSNESLSEVLQCLRAIKYKYTSSKYCTEGTKSSLFNIPDEKPRGRKLHDRLLIPYTQNKLSLFLHSLLGDKCFNHGKGQINCAIGKRRQPYIKTKNSVSISSSVTLLVSAYPGIHDYDEKEKLLNDIHSLRGISIPTFSKLPKNKNDSDCTFEYGKKEGTHAPQSNSSPLCNECECDNTVPIYKYDKDFEYMEQPPEVLSPLYMKKYTHTNKITENINKSSERYPESNKTKLSPFKLLSNLVSPFSSTNKRQKLTYLDLSKTNENKWLIDRIHTLEKINNSLEKECKIISSHNQKLKRCWKKLNLRINGELNFDNSSKQLDINNFQKELKESRENRIRQQNLLSSPLRNHIVRVEECNITNITRNERKKPFSLLNKSNFSK